MSHPPESSPPPIAAGDICVFTHGTHAVSIVDDAGRHEQVTLGDARRTVVDVNRAGNTVWLGAEYAPAAIESAQALAGPRIHFENFSPDTRPGDPDTLAPLAAACRDGSTELIDDLLARGADVNTPDSFGLTPVHYTSAAQDEATTRRLLAAGAKRANLVSPHTVHTSSDRRTAAEQLDPQAVPTGASGRIRFPLGALGLLYLAVFLKGPLALTMLAGAVLLVVDDESLVGAVIIAVIGLLLPFIRPSWRGIFRGTLTSITSSHLLLSRPLLPPRRLDVARVQAAAATPPVFTSDKTGSFWSWRVVVAHPDGYEIPSDRQDWRPLPTIVGEEWRARGLRMVAATMQNRRGLAATVQLGRRLRAAGVRLEESYYDTCRDGECRVSFYRRTWFRMRLKR